MNGDDTGYNVSENLYSVHNMSKQDAAALHSYMTACEVLNALVLAATLWILVCMVVYGVCTKKFSKKSRNKIYIASFVAIASSLPDAIVILVLYNVSEAATQSQCEIVMDLATAFSSFGLLGTYIFLWLRQRAIYNNKYMRAIYGRWIHGISWFLLILIVVCLFSVACVSIVERSIYATDVGCVLQHHKESGNSSLSWEGLRIIELCATTLCQIGFLFLFLYPMIQNKKMIKKVCAKQKKRRDKVGEVIKRCTTCATIVIISDIATEIWIQFIPSSYPAIVIGTVNGLDLFVDVICVLATFDDITVILTVLCRSKASIYKKRKRGATLTSESHESDKKSMVLLDMTGSTRKTSLLTSVAGRKT